MSSYKYVMFEDKHGRKFPVIFPEELVHSDMAEAVMQATRRGEVGAGKRDYSCPKPVSAGFIKQLDVVTTYGASETLNLKSHPEDANLIVGHPYTKGL